MSDDVILKALTTALERAEDMFMQDDGQAWKEYERVRAQLHEIAGKPLPEGPKPEYSLHITHDPSIDFDFDENITLACAHNRYRLGDGEGMDDFMQLLDRLMASAMQTADDDSLFTDEFAMQLNATRYQDQPRIIETLEDVLDLEALGVRIKPLYLMDHSGLAISTTPFSCPWDSGQVGYVFTKEAEHVSEEMIDSYVNSYSEYLAQGYTQYVVFDKHGQIIDGCTGFTGTDPVANGMKDHISDDVWENIMENDNIHVGG